ncbi:MAG: hypothetical protein NTNFB02_29760 [Nitrospira sp.]
MWRMIALLTFSALILSCSGEGGGGNSTPTAATHTTPVAGVNAPTTVSSSDQQAIKDRVTSTIGPLPAGWNDIVFDEIERRQIRMTLMYANAPANPDQVKNDTYKIAKAALRVLAESGRDSQREMVTVVVNSQVSGAGQTGATNMVGSFGTMTYDYTTDQLTFKPAKS